MHARHQPRQEAVLVLQPAITLLLNLEAAQQGKSVMFSDKQKLLFKGGKKGFAKNTKLDFMSR
jgi:hypothetical protein